MPEMIEALAAKDQPTATFTALEQRARAIVGAKLFTLLTLDRDRGVARRCYSSAPEAYPVSGEKPMQPGPWSDIVVDRHETFVANTIDEIAAVFPDHALIQSLGCESCVNIPIVVGGDVIGTLNCLNEAHHYSRERVAASERLKKPGALAFLLAAALEKRS